MKSIYYNWKKSHDPYPQKNHFTDEETWGQFVDLEINDYYNDKRKINKHTNLMKYEPSLFTIQENNIVNIQSKVIIYDSSYMFILSMSALGVYTLVQIFMQHMTKYHG
jgi:3'-phosphoadenosine 5'-phosphosulfate sulfotransferase (PAPS reductase)/FAD synthetase